MFVEIFDFISTVVSPVIIFVVIIKPVAIVIVIVDGLVVMMKVGDLPGGDGRADDRGEAPYHLVLVPIHAAAPVVLLLFGERSLQVRGRGGHCAAVDRSRGGLGRRRDAGLVHLGFHVGFLRLLLRRGQRRC